MTSSDKKPKNNFHALAADDSNAMPPLWKSALRALLWLAMLAWFVILGNYRCGNPLGL
jgi:hypothetical protein